MNAFHIWLFKVSMFTGILVIIMLSCDDFRKNVRKFISRWRYYFAGSIFVIVNLFVYLILTYAVIQQSPAHVIYGGVDIKGNYIKMIMPLLLAFVYFGAGAGSFRLGNKEIQINKKLRAALEGMFNSKPLTPGDVSYSEEETEQLYERLRKETEKIGPMAKVQNWDGLWSQWNEFKEDETVLNEQKNYLKTINDVLIEIRQELTLESSAAGKLSGVVQNIQDRIRDILKSLIKKAQKLCVSYAFRYFKDEVELGKYLVEIEVMDKKKKPIPYIPSAIDRGLILGFMFGLLFGPLFSIFKGADVIYYCWRGSFTLMLFTGCISYGIQSGSWKKSVLVAGIGGYAAHLLWFFIDKANLNMLLTTKPSFEWLMKPNLYTEPIIGLSFGIATALILFALKFIISSKLSNRYVLYAIAMISGAVFYPILSLLISSHPTTITSLTISSGVGAIAMSSLSLAVNIAMRDKDALITLSPERANSSA